MNFKEWLLNEESIEQNFNQWIEDIKKYAQPNELELKTINVDEKQKQLIIQALKKANQEKQEYIKYLLGFIKSKPHALPEDFDRSLDAIKWAITTNKISKQQIANDGWYNTGKKSQDIIRMKDEEDSSVSKRQISRDKKSGISYDLTPEFVSGNYKIYFIPKITNQKVNKNSRENFLKLKITNERHKLLCKYGKDTRWCTATPTGTYHANYAHRDIYVVHENDKPIFQFTKCTNQDNDDTCQFMDTEDHPAKEIPYELAKLIMEKLPDIGKFYKVVYSSFFINKIKNTEIKTIEDILKIFQVKTLDELTDDYIDYLILHSTNKDLIAELIINYKKELSDNNIKNLISYIKDRNKIKTIIDKKPESIFNKDVLDVIEDKISSKNDKLDEEQKYNIAELIINKNPEIPYDNGVQKLLFFVKDQKNKEKIANLIIDKKPELSDLDVFYLISSSYMKYRDKIAQQIINKKSKLSDSNIDSLMSYSDNTDYIANLIIGKKPELSGDNVYRLILYSKNQKQIAAVLVNNINKLNGESVCDLLGDAISRDSRDEYANKNEINHFEQMVEILGKNNIIKIIYNLSCLEVFKLNQREQIIKIIIENRKVLSGKNVKDLLSYSPINSIDEIAELLQQHTDNISRLSFDDIASLSQYKIQEYKNKLVKILNKYHQKKTPEIQKLIKFLTYRSFIL